MDNEEYRVGYKKPPKHSQFKKGGSGNAKGRPKRTRNLKTDLAEELAEQIVVREGERTLRVSKQRAIVKSLTAKTLRGDARAAAIILSLISNLLGLDNSSDADQPLSTDELELLKGIEQRLLSSRNLTAKREPQGERSGE